jgi:hypothetical protein
MMIEFDQEFANPADYARLYRGLGVQVVPAHHPSEGGQWKRPFGDWLEFQDALAPDAVFARWYDPLSGEHRRRLNMGFVCGRASGGLLCVDLDRKAGSQAAGWWDGVLAVHLNGLEPDTWAQRTGGGGRQLFFRAPDGWAPPTFKTSIGVDIRGQGGFAMTPPSRHASGQGYEWELGREPWACELADAPEGLIEAIDTLREAHAANAGSAPRAESVAGGETLNAVGLQIDDREHKLQAAVWGAVVDLYRESPIPPGQDEQAAEISRIWSHYEATTKSRLDGPQFDTLDNAARLEREGRGLSELRRKWRYAIGRWETKVRAAARAPKPSPRDAAKSDNQNQTVAGSVSIGPDSPEDPDTPPARMVMATPFRGEPPARQWLVADWIVEGSVNSFYGASGLGKSLLALQLAASVSLGQPWLGLTSKAGPVLMVSCEDDAAELHRRTDAIKRAMGYAIGWPFADLHIADRVGLENRLAISGRNGNVEAGPFLDELEREVEALKPALLILDTLADVYAANEIDRGQVNYFLKAILGGLIARQAARGHTLTVLLLGHPSDSGRVAGGKGYSGSGAWEAGVRSRLYLSREEDGPPDDRILTRGKANYASAGEDTGIRVNWSDGVFRAEDERAGDPDLARTRARALMLIGAAWDARAPYTQQRGHRLFVFKALTKILTDEGVARQTALQAIRELVMDGPVESHRRGGHAGLKVID